MNKTITVYVLVEMKHVDLMRVVMVYPSYEKAREAAMNRFGLSMNQFEIVDFEMEME